MESAAAVPGRADGLHSCSVSSKTQPPCVQLSEESALQEWLEI